MNKLFASMAAALLAVNLSIQAEVTVPATPVCASSTAPYPAGSFSFADLTLSGVPGGFSVGNQTYPGWCVDAYNYNWTPGAQYCQTTLRLSTDPNLPAHFSHIPWGIVNYIINHKQGTPLDVQNAIWWFTDGRPVPQSQATAASSNLCAVAASQASYVPGPGDLVAIVVDLGTGDHPQHCIIECPPTPENPGTGTPGFWKNHPEAWPVSTITLGGVTYTVAQAIAIMQQPTATDKTYNLAEHLIAAKLNVSIGNDSSCIAETIADADAFLALYPIGSGLRASSSAWRNVGGELLTELTAYNEGLLCAPSRD